MFHLFARTEPPKQRKPLHSLVWHGYSLTWFTYIFDCLWPTERENLQLRPLCKLFSKALKPLPCWTSYPHPGYTLRGFLNRFNELSESGSTNIPKLVLIDNGTHNEGGDYVNITTPISIVGESRDHCIVLGGLETRGKKEDDVNVSNLTLQNSKNDGVCVSNGASVHLDNVSVKNSEGYGVFVRGTKRSTMKNCNVSYSEESGLCVVGGGLMTIDGQDTTIHHNCTDESYWNYGLDTDDSSSIQLVSPLTKEMISTDNGGGGNYGGQGTIVLTTIGLCPKTNDFRSDIKKKTF